MSLQENEYLREIVNLFPEHLRGEAAVMLVSLGEYECYVLTKNDFDVMMRSYEELLLLKHQGGTMSQEPSEGQVKIKGRG